MASEQTNITEAISKVAAETARTAVQAMAMAMADNSQRIQNVVPDTGGPIMKQPTFDLEADDTYSELKVSYER